jgi:hypothetical protein
MRMSGVTSGARACGEHDDARLLRLREVRQEFGHLRYLALQISNITGRPEVVYMKYTSLRKR